MAPPPPPSPRRVLSLLLALLCASPGLGGPGVPVGRCGVQPHAWCQSWETALRCGALAHCARRGWAPGAKEDMCADCQEIISLLTRMANESAAKVAVEGFLQRECTALPVPTMVPPCQRLVHEYFGLFVASLEGHLKPAALCARLDLCPGEPMGATELMVLMRDRRSDAHSQATLGEDLPVPLPLCWLCRTFISRAEAAIPKETLATAAARLCRVLPAAVAGACQCLAERYTVIFLEMLLGKVGPRLLCSKLFSCGAEDSRTLLAPAGPGSTQAPGAGTCQACMAATAGANGSAVEDALLRACTLAGAAPECQALVRRHGRRLLARRDEGWDSSALCRELGLCQVPPEPALSLGPCVLGPAYWCSSPEAAQRCQAVQHCQAHVWA
ncbi:pulmonary surfactant-associated protein B [Struthio camelus]|uniref:pulmonary surfactant-associated protein B n=1 Tax=Struthio camelus TaxID=8801 RepID=UPI0036042DA1